MVHMYHVDQLGNICHRRHVYRCEQPTLISVLCSQRQNIHGADGADGAGGAAREQNNEL